MQPQLAIFPELQSSQPGYKGASYDLYNQLTSVSREQSGNSLTTNFAYDSQHNLHTVTPLGAPSTTYVYDDFGRVTSETSLLSGNWSYLYDADGNCTSRTDPNGSVTTSTYDALDRPLTSKSIKGSTTESVAWTYDNATAGAYGIGRLATMTDPTGSASFSYEPRGHLIKDQRVVNGATYATSYTYDVDDDLSTLTMPSSRVLTYTYDYAHRPVTLSGAFGGTTTKYITGAVYLPFGPNAQLTYGNGTTQTWTFNQRYRPYQDKIVSGSTALSNVAYAEDNLGQISQIDDLLNVNYDRTISYAVNNGGPGDTLSSVSTGSSLWGSASYTEVGLNFGAGTGENIGSINIGSTSINAGFDANDHLASVTTNGTNKTATVDAAGNQTALNSATYSYSPRNLLASGEGLSYNYDGFGQRLVSKLGSNTQVSLYDRAGHLTTESAFTSSSVAHDYIWFAGKPVAQEDLGATPLTSWTHTNDLGAPFLQTSRTATVSWKAEYDPYGNIYSVRTGASTTHEPLRLPGQEAVMLSSTAGPGGSSQLLYNQSRWYIPTLGRYLTPDPIGYAGDPYDQYAYAANNPHNRVDPDGLDPNDYIDGGLDWVTYGITADITNFLPGRKPDTNGPSYRTGTYIGMVLGLADGASEYHFGQWLLRNATRASRAQSEGAGASCEFKPYDVDAGRQSRMSEAAGAVTGRGSFSSTTNAAGGEVFTSVGNIKRSDFAGIANSGLYRGEVNILTGMHGLESGVMVPESRFYDEDVDLFGEAPGVNIYNLTNMSSSQITDVLNGPGTTIGAFCNSGICLGRFR